KDIPEILTKYLRIGFKLVPLGNDSTPTVNSTNEIYGNPDYWTEEKLTQNYWRFSNIATTFGITHIQETKDDLYLHCLDRVMLAIDDSRRDRVPEGYLRVGRGCTRYNGYTRSNKDVPFERSIFSVCFICWHTVSNLSSKYQINK